MHVDGASNARGAGAGVVLTNPDKEKLRYALRFEFKASNNEAEYEALIVGLELANKLGAQNLRIHCDSQLIVNQVKGDYAAKEPHMIAYLSKAQKNLEALSWFEIVQVPREANVDADALARLASGIDEEGEGSVPIEVLTRPYVSRSDVGVVDEVPPPSWMTPLLNTSNEESFPKTRKKPES